nr:transposase [Cohnella terricola]
MAKAVRKNIMFMWIAGRKRLDFRTINQFRSERMKAVLETVFTAVLQLPFEENYVQLQHYFLEERQQEEPKDKPLKKAVRTLRRDLLPAFRDTRLMKPF